MQGGERQRRLRSAGWPGDLPSCGLRGLSCQGYQALGRPAITRTQPKEQRRLQIQRLMISLSGSGLVSKCLGSSFYFNLHHNNFFAPSFCWIKEYLPDFSFLQYSVNTVAHMVFISPLLLLFPCLLQTLVNSSWPNLSAGPNLSPGARLRSLLTLTLFELDPGDQIAPNITCYFCTVAVDRTLGLQLSGMLVERLFSVGQLLLNSEKAELLIHMTK